ncbi:uncharacterized protein LOC114519874 [Dendronephthya gigantea]|uniref:uncharacterized protein LOC114519874 n=1 Tax=Dendronephthya gigantea TaxID=151771 RepID=UPI00106C97E9|nr:uncharacterized protein LOC114519874 [Dendronephthya gigantea]XP_028395855.1 uncharacterized protein LOC114519874 [Dendronephthya gigantea]
MTDQTNDQLTRNIVKLILYSLAVLINNWLLFVLWRDPLKRLRNFPSLIIANLALVEIVGAIGGLGQTTAIFVCAKDLSCVDIHKLFACIQTIGLQNSFVFIALLAFDRFLAISSPYRYQVIFGNKYIRAFICISAWATGLILSPLVHYVELNKKGQTFVLHQLYVADVTILAVITAVLYPLNYYNYLRRKRLLNASLHREHAMEDLRLAQQMNVSAMIVATVFFTALAPYAIVLVYTMKDCIKCLTNKTFYNFWVNYQAVIAVVLFIHPIIYAWRLPLYRNSSIAVGKQLLNMISSNKRSTNSMNRLSISNSSRSRIQFTSSTAINDVYV